MAFLRNYSVELLLGGFALLIFDVLFSLIRLRLKRGSAGIINVLLALAAWFIICGAVIGASFPSLENTGSLAAVLAGTVVLIVIGLVLFVADRRSENFEPGKSAGSLYAGIGVFTLVAALIIPVWPSQLAFSPPSPSASASTTPSRTAPATRTPRETLTLTALPSLTQTPTAIPTLTPRATDTPLIIPTSVAVVLTVTEIPAACYVTTSGNVQLRSEPTTQKPAITLLQPNTRLAVQGLSSNRQWWRVIYQEPFKEQAGWVNVEVVTAEADCQKLTPEPSQTRTPSPTRTPSITLTPSLALSAAKTRTSPPGGAAPALSVTFTPESITADGALGSCSVRTTSSLSLRPDASLRQPPLAQIPARVDLPATGISSDRQWWRVIYTVEGQPTTGWVGGGFVIPSASCNDVPVIKPSSTPVP